MDFDLLLDMFNMALRPACILRASAREKPVAIGNMKAKRSDLQAIRGIAIIAVLLFHFFPDWFPNGYIGVDQFFVLSGYLIAMILSGSQLDLLTIETFYYRRIKRIVPLYILFVFLVLISMFVFFPSTNIDLNVESAQYALSFTTNYQGISADKQYTVMLHLAVDVFTHTWSLSVEMQFYLLVPIIFFISNKFGRKLVVAIGFGSILYNVLVDENTAFNSVFARLWQFCIGIASFMVVSTIQKPPAPEDENFLRDTCPDNGKSRESKSKRVLIVLFLNVCLWSILFQELIYIAIPPMLLRLSISVLTGILIILGSEEIIFPMNNRILVYMGDISYALYLVHWPLYSYVKLEYPEDFKVLCLALFLSICLAVFITETYEKCYLKMEKCSVLALIGTLYGLCLVVLICYWKRAQNVEDFENVSDIYFNITKEDAIQLNEKWRADEITQICGVDLTNCQYERAENFTSDGPSILLFGNSFASNAAETVKESCNGSASRIRLHWETACEMLVSTRSFENCQPEATDGFMDVVRREKPDILFLLARYIDLMKPLEANVSILEDSLYKEAIIRLNNYEQIVSKTIYVLDAIPRSDDTILKKIENGLRQGNLPNMTDLIATGPERSEYAKLRLSELVKNCKKCQMIDYSPYLTVGGEFQFYDRSNGLAYINSGMHLTPYALRKVQPIFRKICRSF